MSTKEKSKLQTTHFDTVDLFCHLVDQWQRHILLSTATNVLLLHINIRIALHSL